MPVRAYVGDFYPVQRVGGFVPHERKNVYYDLWRQRRDGREANQLLPLQSMDRGEVLLYITVHRCQIQCTFDGRILVPVHFGV